MALIRPEQPADRDAVRGLLAAAFGNADAEGLNDESRLVDRLRDEGYAAVSLVAEEDGRIVGHVVFSEVAIETADKAPHDPLPALSLAPLAVAPDRQREGIGSELVRRGLDECRRAGWRIVLVVGHPEYYRRFGFSRELARALADPFSAGDAFMALELEAGALEGVTGAVKYSPPFTDLV